MSAHVVAFTLNDTTGITGYTKTVSLVSSGCDIAPIYDHDWYVFSATDADMKSRLGSIYWREETDTFWDEVTSLESVRSGGFWIYVKKW